ncbi:MAG: putative protein N(5)-glutamine methyltransferase [Actinophytocola sp.]|nr:putative protein N(5)-glutamine methyltransferase [Actinophytocola sp.]
MLDAPDSHADIVARLRFVGCVFAEDEAHLLLAAARSDTDLAGMVDRRSSGTPLEHILGWAEFRGLRIIVHPGVFVPRRRTEFLVDCAAELAAPSAIVVDVCCGSGAVGAALQAALPSIELHATDVDSTAVPCARRNIAPAGGHAYVGDLTAPLPPRLLGRVDIMTANAPYVPTDKIGLMPPEARLYEPQVALDGGPDGLDVQRRIIAAAPRWLAAGGHLLIESNERQAANTADAMASNGLTPRIATSDDVDTAVVIGTR